MRATPTPLPGVMILEPTIHRDDRGAFFECWNDERFRVLTGADCGFVQDNHSVSNRNVLRGLHYQIEHAQGKLVRCVAGAVFDVAVDVRRSSPHFGRWFGTTLSASNHHMLWVPPGFAHGFLALSDGAEVVYKITDGWSPAHERTILWSDPAIGIEWPCHAPPILAARDGAAPCLADAEVYP